VRIAHGDGRRVSRTVGYEVDATWPAKPGDLEWGETPSVAVDTSDRVWILTRAAVPVQIYGRDGRFIGAWGANRFTTPHALTVDHSGNVWIADADRHIVQSFTQDGDLRLTIGSPDEAGWDSKHFNGPTGIATSPSGDVFVSDGYGNGRIAHFDAAGRFVKAWGRLGAGRGEFWVPHAIVMDSKGLLYVAERNNPRVQVFDQAGHVLEEWPHVMIPWGMCMAPNDDIYVCGSSPMPWGSDAQLQRMKEEYGEILLGLPPKDQIVMRFSSSGRLLQLWSFPTDDGSRRAGRLDWVHGIATDSDGSLYVGEIMGERAQKFVRVDASRAA
jgi:NHL repeat